MNKGPYLTPALFEQACLDARYVIVAVLTGGSDRKKARLFKTRATCRFVDTVQLLVLRRPVKITPALFEKYYRKRGPFDTALDIRWLQAGTIYAPTATIGSTVQVLYAALVDAMGSVQRGPRFHRREPQIG